MKKLLAVFVVVFALAGCTGGVDTNSVVTMSGYIGSNLSDSDFGGTHILTMDGGNTVALESPSLNLSASKYGKAEVELVGKYNKKGVLVVSGVSVLSVIEECDTENDDCDEVDDDGTGAGYTNTDLGFAVKYPSDWSVLEGSNITFFPPEYENESSDVDSIVISQFEFTPPTVNSENSDSLSPLFNLFDRDFSGMGSAKDFMVKVGPASSDALEIKTTEGTSYYVYRNGQNLVYDISFVASSLNSKIENEREFKKTLNSFRMIGYGAVDASDSTEDVSAVTEVVVSDIDYNDDDYTSFASLPFHFTAKYPSDWYYSGSSMPGVLHHYGFSDESVTDTNELISMDVISGDLKKGTKLSFGTESYKVNEANGKIGIYLTVDGRNYHLSASSKHEDIMMVIASSISPATQ